MSRPPLGLSVNVTDASGAVTRWSSNDPNSENRPRNLTFSSQRMQGFATASLELSRRIDRDFVDLHLFDDLQIVGDDGSTAWEGRVAANPRSSDQQQTMTVQCAGWMANAKDRKFSRVYVDRDLNSWGEASRARRVALLAASTKPFDPLKQTDGSGTPTVTTLISDSFTSVSGGARCEAWYDCGPGQTIASIYYEWAKTGAAFGTLPSSWYWQVYGCQDDATTNEATVNLVAAGPSTGTFTFPTPRRYGMLFFAFGAAGGAAGYVFQIDWSKLAVYGNHGLPLAGETNPKGILASDAIKHIIGTYCPKLNAAGVQPTTYPIPHLVISSLDPYDAFLDINKYHLWDLSVWENRTAYYEPMDLTDYDWDIRLDDPGTSTTLQGDSTEDLANGIAISFQNVNTGAPERLTPDGYPELRDASISNPANTHGLTVWTEYQISVPTTVEAALQIGRAALAEYNQPKASGSISAGPYVRDRQGHWQPAWKVRSGDRVAITSSTSLSDRPRLIQEASYTHGANGTGSVTMAIDSTFKTLEAVIDRMQTALAAAGLS